MKRTQTKKTRPRAGSATTSLEQAVRVRDRLVAELDRCQSGQLPKLAEAWSKATNTHRQLERDRKKALTEFSDDELVDYVRTLPERRREALVTAIQGASLAGRPLF